MRHARSLDDFVRAPVGTWIAVGTSLFWCASPTLCGTAAWGRPSEDDARAATKIFEHYSVLAKQFDILLDGSAVEGVDPAALGVLLDWMEGHMDVLRTRVRRRVGVIPGGLHGVTLSGISPALGGPGPVQLVRDAREGFRLLAGDAGDQLCDEVSEIARSLQGTSPLLLELRSLLGATNGTLSVAEAARRLGVSSRSLQRELGGLGRTYREEQRDARFRVAEQLLASDEKLAAVAARLGLTEAGLTLLVRAKTGMTPGELRKKLRG